MGTLAQLAGLLGLAVLVYYLTTLMIWLGHYLPHRTNSRLREFHVGGHHRHYPDPSRIRQARFVYGQGRNDSLVPQLPWLIGLAGLLWFGLPTPWGIAAVCELSLLALASSYLHMHFHLTDSPFLRYAWFRHARAAHDLHHGQERNFMVVDHFWDRCFGTYREPDTAR